MHVRTLIKHTLTVLVQYTVQRRVFVGENFCKILEIGIFAEAICVGNFTLNI